jgi:hypothetical protein
MTLTKNCIEPINRYLDEWIESLPDDKLAEIYDNTRWDVMDIMERIKIHDEWCNSLSEWTSHLAMPKVNSDRGSYDTDWDIYDTMVRNLIINYGD